MTTSREPVEGGGLPDVVYIVKKSKHNEELRYSMRSVAANLPHRRVWVAGHLPRWASDQVGHIPTVQNARKWDNQQINLAAACAHPEVGDRFVMFNDDFFVVEPIVTVPVLHQGSLAKFAASRLGKSEWRDRIQATAAFLPARALAYDGLHVPMTFEKSKLAELLDALPPRMLYRSVYGNVFRVGGDIHPNVKVSHSRQKLPEGPFWSTSDSSFTSGHVGRELRRRFAAPSRFEK